MLLSVTRLLRKRLEGVGSAGALLGVASRSPWIRLPDPSPNSRRDDPQLRHQRGELVGKKRLRAV